jgi:hypothetical protein
MAKRTWSDLSTSGKAAILVGAALQAVVTTLALRDLQARPSSLVRGSKALWRLAFLIQPAGPIGYLLAGRRK